MLTIHTLTFNEEIILPYFIKHYKKNFPDCLINIYDNESTDNTVKIAKEHNCEVITYKTNNELSDEKYLDIKNNVWKTSTTDWNLICDVDEFCIINHQNLCDEDKNNISIIKFRTFDMVNTSKEPNSLEIDSLNFGVRNSLYDKDMLFNKKYIKEINYEAGCHFNNASGIIKYATNEYIMRHYKYIGENFIVNRYKNFLGRLSQKNLNEKWGSQYLMTEEEIRKLYKNNQNKSTKII
jgi:hypothetical protein